MLTNVLRPGLALLVVATASLAGMACSYTPRHEVRNKPEYIRAGVQPGETVEIVTKDGRELEFVVTDIEENAVVGEQARVEFADIQSIAKRSWTTPKHPCGGEQPLGCSIPEVLSGLSEDFDQQATRFHPACVQHDFCYRHGFATYGLSREDCDTEFYENMKDTCGTAIFSFLDFRNAGACRLTANRMYDAVRRHGEKHYRTTTSSYCEYRP